MIPLCYGLGTLVALWAFGGGEPATYWARQPLLGLTLLILGLGTLFWQKRLPKAFTFHSGTLMLGAGSALAAAIPAVVVIWMSRHMGESSLPLFKAAVTSLRPPSFGAVLIGALLVAPGHEIISRGILSPAWGIGGVAFLDALTIGFGTQQLVPFVLFWMLGYFWGFLARQFGLMTSLLSRVLWTLIVMSAHAYL